MDRTTDAVPKSQTEHAETPHSEPLRFAKDDSDEFYKQLKKRVAKHLRDRGVSRFGGRAIVIKGFVLSLIALSFYLITLLGGLPTPLTLLSAIVFGVFALLIALNIGHDAAHGAIAPGRKLNDTIQLLAFSLVGADSYMWQLRHVKSHHISPNVRNHDVDVGENGLIRLSPSQRHRWFYRYQHIYAPLVFGIVNVHTAFWYDFRCLLSGKVENFNIDTGNVWLIFRFLLLKVIFLTVMLVVPYLVMDRPWWHIAIGAFLITFVNSIVFLTLLIGTHHCEETRYPEAGGQGRLSHGWAYHQVVTAFDWLPFSKITNFFAGGANTHVAHHLFPNVSHVHYVEISRIILDEANKYGIPYKYGGFTDMIRSHYGHLKRLGSAST
jgi:linoleoyl-CoA desaturase